MTNPQPLSSCRNTHSAGRTLRCVCFVSVLAAMVVPGLAREIGKFPTSPSEAGYSTESVVASGQRGGALLPYGANFTEAFNREMGEAMEIWNAHRWGEAVERFERIYTEHPDSPWAAEAELHIACYLRFNCRYGEAEERFVSVLRKYYENEGIRKRVLHYLPHLYALRGRVDVAMDLLNMLGESPLTWQERQHLENWRRIYLAYLRRDEEDRRCGVMAAALALAASEGGDPDRALANVSLRDVYHRYPWSLQRADHPGGYSLQDLAVRVDGYPRRITFAELSDVARPGRPVVAYLSVPPEPRVYDEVGRKRPATRSRPTGHFVVVESVKGRLVQVLDPRGGRSYWAAGHFKARWSGDVLLLAQDDLGTALSPGEAQALRGGCCGSPPPPPTGGLTCPPAEKTGSSYNGPDLTVSGPGGVGLKGCQGCQDKGQGSPGYDFDLPTANLVVVDTPMWYPPALGPPMRIELTYNRVNTQNMATNGAANYYSFGNKWSCNFNSFIVERPSTNGSSGADIQATGPGGQMWVCYSTGTAGEYDVADTRARRSMSVGNEGGTNKYTVTFMRTMDQMVFSTNSTTAIGQQIEAYVDRYGNELQCQYDASGRITNAVDEIGRFFAFEYDSNGYVTNITDALNRNCSFTYSGGGNLTSITDMGGYTSTIGYDTNNWITSIEYPDESTVSFAYQSTPGLEPEDTYYFLEQEEYVGSPMRIRMTNELNEASEYFYHAFGYMGPITMRDRAGNEWLYGRDDSPDNPEFMEVIYTEGVNAETKFDDPEFYDWDIIADRWAHRDYDASGNPIRSLTATNEDAMLLYVEDPMDVWYGPLNMPEYARETNHLARYFYYDTNSWMTLETWHTGGVFYASWSNAYDDAGNVVWHRDALSNEVGATYNDTKDLLSFTNRLGDVTRMGYNGDGRITALTNARDKVTSSVWNDSGWNTAVTFADGSVITGSYDSIGRLDWIKGPSGFEGSLEYDDLDRVTEVVFHTGPNGGETYPNSADTSYYLEYGCCGLDKIEDRLGNETLLVRDALGRVIKVIDAQDHPVLLSYGPMDKVTNLAVVVEGQTNSTVFGYTSTNGYTRLTSRASPLGKTTTYDYTFRGWPKSRTDGEGRTTAYQQDMLGRLTRVAYGGSTNVDLSYDLMNRVTGIVDSLGTNSFLYDAAGQVTNKSVSFSVPGFSNVAYEIDYAFDAVGNVTNRTLRGTTGFTEQVPTFFTYDDVNRLTLVSNAHAHAAYAYDVTNRYMTKTYGNGDVTRNEYDVEWRPTAITTSNGSTQVQGWSYGYNAMGMITGIFASAETNLYGYDAIYQLTSDTAIDASSTGVTSWVYDEAGNRLSQAAPAATNYYLYNADNELTWDYSSDAITVTGEVEPGASSNKWYETWASVGDLTSRVSQADGTFAIPGLPSSVGANTITVRVEDVSGNVATQSVQFTKQNLNGSGFYGYDGNGNLTNEIVWTDGSAVTNVYSYDMENRLTKATSNGVTVLECWYDGVGRRIAKREIVAGATNAVQYVWEGWSILAVLDETGALLESYTRGVGVAYDVGSLVAVRHHSGTHAGSTYYLHHNHRGDVTAVRSGSTTLATYIYAAYGEVANATGSYESRFGFSSKERDDTTGLLYFGFRYLAPEDGRWTTRDPIGLAGGVNLYGFCRDNPVNRLDPSGLQCFESAKESILLTASVIAIGSLTIAGPDLTDLIIIPADLTAAALALATAYVVYEVIPFPMSGPRSYEPITGSEELLVKLASDQLLNRWGSGDPHFNPKDPKWTNIGKAGLVLLPWVIDYLVDLGKLPDEPKEEPGREPYVR